MRPPQSRHFPPQEQITQDRNIVPGPNLLLTLGTTGPWTNDRSAQGNAKNTDRQEAPHEQASGPDQDYIPIHGSIITGEPEIP